MGWAATTKAGAESCELCRRRKSRAHELDLVKDPKRVIIQQAEVHRPPRAVHTVTTIQRTAKKHVLCADENNGTFGMNVPFVGVFTSHENDG